MDRWSLLFLLLGLPLLVFGAWRVVDPVGFFAFNGLSLPGDPGSLSEARGAGGLVFGLAAVILAGVLMRSVRRTSALLAALVFLSYAAARTVGVVLDGAPPPMVLQGLASEVVMGAVAVAGFFGLIRTEPAGDSSPASGPR